MDVQNGLYTVRIEMRDEKRSYATGVIFFHSILATRISSTRVRIRLGAANGAES